MAQRKKTTKAKPAAKRPSRKLTDLEPRDADKVRGGADWEALKQYRVWDANRKVFTYPENWLKP
jgi:hypothetical protein